MIDYSGKHHERIMTQALMFTIVRGHCFEIFNRNKMCNVGIFWWLVLFLKIINANSHIITIANIYVLITSIIYSFEHKLVLQIIYYKLYVLTWGLIQITEHSSKECIFNNHKTKSFLIFEAMYSNIFLFVDLLYFLY